MNTQSSNSNGRSSVQVHIERLVVDASLLSAGQSDTLQTAVETELTRLLAEHGPSHSSAGAVPHLSANSIQVTRDSKPAQLGHQIARALHATLMPGARPR